MTIRIAIATALLALSASAAHAACETNVDKVALFYINGMFTDYAGYESNLLALEQFMDSYFSGWDFEAGVQGAHNQNENALSQVFEVARQKFEDIDASARLALLQFLNKDPAYVNDPAAVQVVQDFLRAINAAYIGILAEQDTVAAKAGLTRVLDTCARVVVITHSQGNFYGNALFNDLYADYVFPNGYPLAQYPMLGTMQIASPVYNPGGAAGSIYPDVVGHITNDNDLVMAAVRVVVGSVPANYDAQHNPSDFSGHSLVASYLQSPAQASYMAGEIGRIIDGLTPYPLHGQQGASSSALSGFGYSALSDVLDIEFASGGVYRYSDVLDGTFEALRSAASQGAYFNEHIRDIYSYTQLE